MITGILLFLFGGISILCVMQRFDPCVAPGGRFGK
jgi:hypothetical protein